MGGDRLQVVEPREADEADRADQLPSIRQAGVRAAGVALQTVGAVVHCEVESIPTDDGSGPVGFGIGPQLVTGSRDDQVDGMVDPIGGSHPGRGDPLDRRGDQGRVGPVEDRQERTRDHRALGQDAVAGQQFSPDGFVAHGCSQQSAVQRAAVRVVGRHHPLQGALGQSRQQVADRSDEEQVHHPASGRIDRRQHTRHFQHSSHPGTHLEVDLR